MTLKIRKLEHNGSVVFTLSGRVELEQVRALQGLLDSEANAHSIVLDLREVKLVDRDSIEFLARCEAAGVSLINCPLYIGEWILRVRELTHGKGSA